MLFTIREGPEEPFGVLPLGQRAKTRPADMWDAPSRTTTYVYTFPVDSENQPKYVAVWLNSDDFEEDFAATIFGQPMTGVKAGKQYYVGHLEPSKLSSFIKVAPMQGVTEIVLWINARPKPDVDRVVEENQGRDGEQGPFIQLE
jgi:hypothetical protein